MQAIGPGYGKKQWGQGLSPPVPLGKGQTFRISFAEAVANLTELFTAEDSVADRSGGCSSLAVVAAIKKPQRKLGFWKKLPGRDSNLRPID